MDLDALACERVLDLGAGTGALTRDLVARGLDVVAIEQRIGSYPTEVIAEAAASAPPEPPQKA